MPAPRPPYPAEPGLWDAPTLINNVETFANVPPIIRRTAATGSPRSAPRRARGPRSSPWPARFATRGWSRCRWARRSGRSSRRSAAGLADGTIKAVQTGGPSGGCIPAEYLDTPVDYESLVAARLDHGLRRHDRDGPRHQHGRRRPVLHGVLHGRVVRQVHPLPRRHRAAPPAPASGSAQGQGTRSDLEQLEALCDMVKHTSLCGLGQAAPNPVLSTLRYFRHEYEALIRTTPAAAASSHVRSRPSRSTARSSAPATTRRSSRRRARPGIVDPDPLPPRRDLRRRRLPALPGRSRRQRPPAAGLRHPRRGGHDRSRPTRRGSANIAA